MTKINIQENIFASLKLTGYLQQQQQQKPHTNTVISNEKILNKQKIKHSIENRSATNFPIILFVQMFIWTLGVHRENGASIFIHIIEKNTHADRKRCHKYSKNVFF